MAIVHGRQKNGRRKQRGDSLIYAINFEWLWVYYMPNEKLNIGAPQQKRTQNPLPHPLKLWWSLFAHLKSHVGCHSFFLSWLTSQARFSKWRLSFIEWILSDTSWARFPKMPLCFMSLNLYANLWSFFMCIWIVVPYFSKVWRMHLCLQRQTGQTSSLPWPETLAWKRCDSRCREQTLLPSDVCAGEEQFSFFPPRFFQLV